MISEDRIILEVLLDVFLFSFNWLIMAPVKIIPKIDGITFFQHVLIIDCKPKNKGASSISNI